ncbi:hypothetical protein [Photorhabdus tasmaniensis]|nr:hypothetical protein [Photorhabdus tasmaniensis]
MIDYPGKRKWGFYGFNTTLLENNTDKVVLIPALNMTLVAGCDSIFDYFH